MGYTTDFAGELTITPPLPPKLVEFMNRLTTTRRIQRNVPSIYGVDGEFYVEAKGFMGQDTDDTVVDYNRPPASQPGLWLQWEVSRDGTTLEWDGGEKFYNYVEWLAYLYTDILLPMGHTLSGKIRWRGEDFDDMGEITVEGTVIHATGYDDIECQTITPSRFVQFYESEWT